MQGAAHKQLLNDVITTVILEKAFSAHSVPLWIKAF